uniref:Uncharacterized protein n=1 Tax=Glossina brevipalpis TaxID=37001 RepID=A0A1A9WTS4_9MUSC
MFTSYMSVHEIRHKLAAFNGLFGLMWFKRYKRCNQISLSQTFIGKFLKLEQYCTKKQIIPALASFLIVILNSQYLIITALADSVILEQYCTENLFIPALADSLTKIKDKEGRSKQANVDRRTALIF